MGPLMYLGLILQFGAIDDITHEEIPPCFLCTTLVLWLAEAVAIGRTFAAKKDYSLDENKEMVALGTMNSVGPITSCYVATAAGTTRDILFGSSYNKSRYQVTLDKCFLIKDIEMLLFGELTVIGKRGVNLSGGQKQRIRLSRALYQDADAYLLDDPFSSLDVHTALHLFEENVTGALSRKTILLMIHHVDFLPAFDAVLFGEIDDIAYGDTPPCFLCTTQLPFQLVRYPSNYFQRIYFWRFFHLDWESFVHIPCSDLRGDKNWYVSLFGSNRQYCQRQL